MPVTLAGLGTAAPERDASQEALAASAIERCCETPAERRLLPNYYRKTTVQRRGSVLLAEGNGHTGSELDNAYPPRHDVHDRGPGVEQRMRSFLEKAPPLAERAAGAALDDARIDPETIDQLVVVTCTGFASPGVEFELIDRLGLRADIGRTQVGFMGCHGAINGLRVARGLTLAEPGSTALVVCVELCTLHFQYGWNPQRVLANALFADGAAAAVVRSDPEESRNHEPATRGARLLDTASIRLPDSSHDMTWRIEQHGFAMTLSSRVPELIRRHARPWVESWLDRHGLRISDIAGWAIHPGGPRVIAATEDALRLTSGSGDPSRRILQNRGNMSSPTVLFVLRELLEANVEGPVVLLAFGPGLVAEAALLNVQ
ncbi:MAG: type III polyketide synthase [Phycisphaeraceae bacterium]